MKHVYSHDRVSAISGISISPVRYQCTLYCQLWEQVIQGEEVACFLRHLLEQIPGHVIVLLDNGRIHRGDPVQQLLLRRHRLHLVFFPAYAPELNPDEGVWHVLKQRLANGHPGSKSDLMKDLAREVCILANTHGHLRGCIRQTGLT
jgi:transposase